MKNHIRSATLAALLSNLIFGMTFLFSKLALAKVSPPVLIADRYILAFLVMTLVIRIFRMPVSFRGKPIKKLLLMTLCQPIGYFLCESYGILLTTSSFSSVMIALVPIATALMGAAFLGEKTTKAQLALILLAVCGVIVMALNGTSDGSTSIWGILLLIGAVLLGASYTVLSRGLSDAFTALERTYFMAGAGLVAFVPLALIREGGNAATIIAGFANPSYAGSLLFLGIVASIGSFFMLNYANTYLPVARVTAFSSLVPLISVCAGVFILHERITVLQLICAAMIIIGVTGAQLAGQKPSDQN